MIEGLREFEAKDPELVLVWNDKETDAKGWLVINSLRGGAAGGGTRMKAGLDYQEVRLLAKTMEIKFSVSGPQIGGAKSGINFDPGSPLMEGVLRRWYKAILPMLKSCYGTGGDLNVDFVKQVVPFTKEVGLLHPQEGILQGHFDGKDKVERARRLSNGAGRIVKDKRYLPNNHGTYTVADLVSGFSVSESVVHFYRAVGDSHVGKRAIIQGWGSVGSSTGYYLAQAGVKIVGIIDALGGVVKEDGFELEDVLRFLHERKGRKLSGYPFIPYDEMNERFWNIPADIFVPSAASGLVTQKQVEAMINAGVELIACGANNPFADEENFFGPIAQYADDNMSVIPDFIANCGIARVFAYLMQANADVSEEAIFNDISNAVCAAISDACCLNPDHRTQITQKSYQNALRKLV